MSVLPREGYPVTAMLLSSRPLFRSLALLGVLGLAGCETTGMPKPMASIAEVDNPEAANASKENIASLSEVVSRNPQDAQAFNTRG